MPGVLKAAFDFVAAHTVPAIDGARVLQGYQKRAALPQGDDYALISVAAAQRVGTNVGELSASASGAISIKSLRRYTVNVDFCHAEQSIAQGRASSIEIMGRSRYAVAFFAGYGIALLFADDLQYLPFVGDGDQFVHRYRVPLELSRWEGYDLPQDYFDKAALPRIENVDVHHPPRGGQA
jgi:hypothetical protein